MRTRVLLAVSSLLSIAVAGACGDSAECGPGTVEQDGVCVPSDSGGSDDAEDLGGDDDPGMDDMDGMDHDPGDPMDGDDPADPADPGDPGDPADPGDPGDPGDPADPGDPGDPVDPGPGDPAAGCDGGDCSALAHQILDAINAARAAAAEGACAGLAYTWDDGVAGVALANANAQAAAGALMVEGAPSLGDRLDAAGLGFSSVGEVYGRARGTPAEIVEDWMANEDLHPYLTSCEYTLAGIGAAAPAGGGPAFVTGTFLAP